MNGRSGLVTFFLFLLLAVMILFQVLSMIQADRLYERLNTLIDRWQMAASARVVKDRQAVSTDLPGEEYPGDEGDWLVWCERGEPRTLNPISVEGDLGARHIYFNIFETLFYYDLDYDGVKLEPVLAERMEVSDDGIEITVTLKANIWFSDGVPVTADDVVFTYETIMNPGVDAPNIRNYYENFKEVVKIDERTVKFILNEVYWKTLESVGIFEVLPKHIYEFEDPEAFNSRRSNPIGSGPYVFEKWDVGQQVVLRRNENYWGKKAKLEKLIFRFITNPTAALQALRAHEVDFYEPTSEQFAEMSADEEFKKEFKILSYWEPSGGYAFIGWNLVRSFFQDGRVRLAMTHILNRQEMVEHLLRGYGTVVTGPFYIHGRQSDPNVKPWSYAPEKAKLLLDEAGWVDTDGDGIRDKDGVAFRFKYSYPPGGTATERIAKLMKDEAAKVGIEVIPDPVEWSIFVERLNKREFDAVTLMWGGTIESDPYQIWHSSQIKGRGNNFISFTNAEADAIIEEARRTLDEKKRYHLYHKLHRLLHEEQPYTFLFARPEPRFLDKRFENVIVHQLGLDHHEWHVPKEKQRYK
ncbi:MAG: peptide-binding protein [Planctomycetota bacterium]|nr:MAG: peptide-binding protein [Planctomycetota bacterium]